MNRALKFRAILFLFFSFLSPQFLWALSFNDFIMAYQKNSPRIMQLEAEVRSASLNHQISKSSLYPELSLNAGFIDQTSPASSLGLSIPGLNELRSKNYSLSLNIDQTLYAGGVKLNTVNLTRVQAEMSNLRAKSQKEFLTQQALVMALRFKFLKENILVLEESLRVQNKFFNLVNLRVKRGLAKGFEYDQSFAEKTSYELRLQGLHLQKESLSEALVLETGLSAAELEGLNLPSVEGLLVPVVNKSDVNKNWDYQMILAEQEIVQHQIALDRGAERPSLAVGASIGRQSPDFDTLTDRDSQTKTFYVNLKVPLFSGFSSLRKRSQAKSKNFVVQKKKQDILRSLKVNRSDVYLRLKKNKPLIEKNALSKKRAQRGLGRVLAAYKLGKVENIQVVQMQSVYERTSVSYLDLLELYYKDYIAWSYLGGQTLESLFD